MEFSGISPQRVLHEEMHIYMSVCVRVCVCAFIKWKCCATVVSVGPSPTADFARSNR